MTQWLFKTKKSEKKVYRSGSNSLRKDLYNDLSMEPEEVRRNVI